MHLEALVVGPLVCSCSVTWSLHSQNDRSYFNAPRSEPEYSPRSLDLPPGGPHEVLGVHRSLLALLAADLSDPFVPRERLPSGVRYDLAHFWRAPVRSMIGS